MVKPASIRAHHLSHSRSEGDGVVPDFGFDLEDASETEVGTLPDGLGGLFGHHACRSQSFGGGDFHRQPSAEAVFIAPDAADLRSDIARNQAAAPPVNDEYGTPDSKRTAEKRPAPRSRAWQPGEKHLSIVLRYTIRTKGVAPRQDRLHEEAHFVGLPGIGRISLPDPQVSPFQRASCTRGRTGARAIPADVGHQRNARRGSAARRGIGEPNANPASQRRRAGKSARGRRVCAPRAGTARSSRGPAGVDRQGRTSLGRVGAASPSATTLRRTGAGGGAAASDARRQRDLRETSPESARETGEHQPSMSAPHPRHPGAVAHAGGFVSLAALSLVTGHRIKVSY